LVKSQLEIRIRFPPAPIIGSDTINGECVFPDGFQDWLKKSRSSQRRSRGYLTRRGTSGKEIGKAARVRYPKESHCCGRYSQGSCVAFTCLSIKRAILRMCSP
jgi:hypothetical protein